MSGVGEALAIVSCVAGLIQAYDAGARIIRQIKARRQAHVALPPSDLLEESIEKGKKEIEQVVAEGNKRFGPTFEQGDTTAIIALQKITIDTQNALLEGLTQARGDDGIIDFDTCIDTSDKGRVDALIALHALFQRKLEEEMQRKRTAQSKQDSTSRPPSIASSVNTSIQPVAPQSTVPLIEQTPATSPPPQQRVKKSHTFGSLLRRRETSQQGIPSPQMAASPPSPATCSPRASQQEVVPRASRRDTTASTSSTATWSSSGSRSSVVGTYDLAMRPAGPTALSNTERTSIPIIPRQTTSLSTFSMASNLSTASTLYPIINFGGCCKKAYELREGSTKKALSLAFLGMYRSDMAYKCASTKCHFAGKAVPDKKGHQIDTRIWQTTDGLRYRWLFLAKSHMQQQKEGELPSFRCLICTLLGDESGTYHGSKVLLAHIASHQGGYLGGNRLAGPLSFSNRETTAAFEDDFDLSFADIEQQPSLPDEAIQPGAAVVVAASVPQDTRSTEREKLLKEMTSSASVAYDDNPWVTEGRM
ncbi:hypothetical protein LTS15_006836 [Exophiala xenobiotica]|nr:hypothetical protein LTS15_006836 [Exophiala xenobiotica]